MLTNKARGVPRVDDRSGAPWRDLPNCYGPCTTCYNRFVRWRRAGGWGGESWTHLPPPTKVFAAILAAPASPLFAWEYADGQHS
jgi:hypothetical protein